MGATRRGVSTSRSSGHRDHEVSRTLFQPLRDTDYGSRDFAARDPEGNRWSFGTHRGEPLS